MARFGELVPTAGRYVNAADKAMLAADTTADKADERAEEVGGPVAMRLVRSIYQPRAKFGPRWLVEAKVLAGGDTVAIDFAAANKDGTPIEARSQMFAELRDRLDQGEAFDPVVLEYVHAGANPFWAFRDATPEEVAEPFAPLWIDDAEDDAPAPEPVKVGRSRLAKAGK